MIWCINGVGLFKNRNKLNWVFVVVGFISFVGALRWLSFVAGFSKSFWQSWKWYRNVAYSSRHGQIGFIVKSVGRFIWLECSSLQTVEREKRYNLYLRRKPLFEKEKKTCDSFLLCHYLISHFFMNVSEKRVRVSVSVSSFVFPHSLNAWPFYWDVLFFESSCYFGQ